MGLRILITPDGPDGLLVKPAEFLGQNFDAYIEAARRGGCRYDPQRRCQIAPFAALADVVRALREAGFRPDVGADLCLRAEDARRTVAEQAAAKTDALDALERDLAGRGLRLFPFQREGVAYLAARRQAALFDEMGVGKTIQALMAIPAGAPVVVSCPASVKGVWEAEAAKWRPDLKVSLLAGKGKFRWPTPGEMVVCNPEVLPRTTTGTANTGRQGKIVHPDYGVPARETVVIFDEAQQYKNGKAQRTAKARCVAQAARQVGGRTWVLTGTPLENKPPDLWSVLMLPGLATQAFGSWLDFTRLMGGSATGFNHSLEWDGKIDPSVPDRLRRVSLRRDIATVMPDLPEITSRTLVVGKNDFPREALDVCDEVVRQLAEQGIDLATAVDIVEGSKAGLVFSMMSRARAALSAAKIRYVLEMVEDYEEAEEPIVVFSCNLAALNVLAQREGWAQITGSDDAADRTETVRRFQAGELKGLAVSILAGGIGITLTRSHTAIIVQPEWNPGANRQAIRRLLRYGQKSAVQVTRLVAPHALDARITEILTEKEARLESTVDASAVAHAPAPTPEPDWAAMAADATPEVAAATPEVAPATPEVAITDLPPQGRYALPTNEGALNATAFWLVHRPTDGRWVGWTFLSQQLGPERMRAGAVRPDGSATTPVVAGLLSRIAADPRAAMQRYGQEIGACGRCGLPLTNDTSRALGLGPECAAKEA
jgi:hypothetical protein